MRFCMLATGILLIAGFAFGADVDGKWIGSMAGMDGNEITIGYTFKAEGATLTGTTTGPDGREIPIKDGKINGNNISFTIAIDFGGNEMKFEYKGIVKTDQILLTLDMMGQTIEIPLKRAK